MTIDVAIRYKNKLILASDSLLTRGTFVSSNTCPKIKVQNNFVFSFAGSLAFVSVIKYLLNIIKDWEGALGQRLLTYKPDVDLGSYNGDCAIILELNANKEIIEWVHIDVDNASIGVVDLLREDYNIFVAGCGDEKFAAAFRALINRKTPSNLKEMVSIIKEGFQVVHELDTCCNNQVNLMTFTLAKEVLNGKI